MDRRSTYKPKFIDIRVKPPKSDKKTSRRARADEQRCDREGCEKLGECPAPKTPNAVDSNDRYWFCQEHAAEYNRTWNFFKDMSPGQISQFQAGIITGHLPTWDFKASGQSRESVTAAMRMARGQFKDVFQAFGDKAEPERPQARAPKLGRLMRQALADLDLTEEATGEQIRVRYRELVKKFHPDNNAGDRTTEERLQSVIKAYKTLQNGGVLKD